jgi:hypothetical protein
VSFYKQRRSGLVLFARGCRSWADMAQTLDEDGVLIPVLTLRTLADVRDDPVNISVALQIVLQAERVPYDL